MTDNNRKTKVINAPYQYRAAFTIVLVAIILVNLSIVVIALAPEWVSGAFERNHYGFYVVGIVEVLLIYLFWRRAISSTHRVAGPVFAIDRELQRLREGDLTAVIKLRPRDQFQESAESINLSIGHLRDEVEKIKHHVDQLQRDLSPENLRELEGVVARLKTRDDEHTDSEPTGRP